MTPDQLVEFAEALARVAASGGGAKALAVLVAERTGAGVLVEDGQWRPLATAGPGSLPSTARNLNGPRAKTVSITLGDACYGYLSVVPAPADVDEALPLLRLAASTLALELARESDGGRGRRRAFWDRLIAREYPDAGAAREDAAARGIAPAAHYLCIALEAEPGQELRTLVTDAFRSVDGELGIIERGGGGLLVLVPASREVDAENARTAA
ncbi:MAG TPA: hypothetical protein VFN49_05715, partial [Candidatus Aquilonibacter sp.]|nr:hypothetical protein [Candidatus Aquilonibacter sp.]